MSSEPIRILGISGGGRKRSYNTALLNAARGLVDGNKVLFETFDVSGFPLFNQDIENDLPDAVREFKRRVAQADAIFFVTPEYNFSVPAVLKNAIEWGNRPPGDNSWNGKPAAIVSASGGVRGGVRAQLALRQIMGDLNMHPLNRPLLFVGNAPEKFDNDLRLIHEPTIEVLQKILSTLSEWARQLKK